MTDEKRISARELREIGLPIPDNIPDVAEVPMSAIRAAGVTVDPSAEDIAEGKITATLSFSIDASFEWVEFDVTAPEGVDPEEFKREIEKIAGQYDHDLMKHENCVTPHCPICDGGLAVCRTCGGAEGSLPTDCPGRKMTEAEADDVMHARRDFRAGKWVDGTNCPW